jgi:proteasome lid subunit RPN8/RPN11
LLTIPRTIVERILSEAEAVRPNECCGLLGGKGELVARIFPITNREQSPTGYFMDPQGQFDAARKMREEGFELLGIYHSHPSSPPYPSARDVKLAFHRAVHVIVSLLRGDEGAPAGFAALRAFRISEGTVAEVPVRIL